MVWQAGQLLHNGKYEILEILGRGGFGLTYKARHRQLPLEVVIKTPDILQKRDTEYEDYVRQFEAEALKLAKFSQPPHAHIVRVSDFFTEGQVPCLVMDFIQGQTLMERVKTQGKLSEAECLKYIRQIGSALEAVHQAGIVHRDAHPGNIMIQPNGNAILIDFGIAKEIIPAGSSTDYAANPSFAPYEQVYKGSKANRQPSVDIYALAASFYYAVTGQKPTPSMERRLDNRPLTSPKKINPNLSDHLNKAITLGMALEKENRPQSMSDWLQQLELPPPPVPEQYRQEIVNPPPAVEEKYRQEIVNPPQPRKEPKEAEKKAPVNPNPSDNSLQKKLKALPWGWLIGVFFVYGVIGYILAANSARWQVWAGAGAAAVAVAGALAGAAAVAVTGAWVAAISVASGAGVAAVAVAGVAAVAVAGSWAWAWAWVVGYAVAGAGAGVVAWAVAALLLYLRESTNQFAPFLFFVFPGLIGGITFSLMSGNVLGGVVTGIGSIVIVSTQGCTALELDWKNFSPFNIFLILAVTNLSGLASGWLLAFLLHSKG